jgi:hypothetical protein
LHHYQAGDEFIQVHDYYNDQFKRIDLPKGKSPQRYAEILYRKSKNQKIEVQMLEQLLADNQERQRGLTKQIERLQLIEEESALRPYEKEQKK